MNPGGSLGNLANRQRSPDSPDRSGDRSAQRIKVWGQRESNRRRIGSATRFPIRDQGRLKTPKINKRPGTCIWDTRVPVLSESLKDIVAAGGQVANSLYEAFATSNLMRA